MNKHTIMIYDAIIIGGGASGLLAAATLSRKGRRVALLEKQPRVGRKLLSTGNGRCNLTNRRAESMNYHGSRQAAQYALKAWPPKRIEALFETLGVPCVSDAEGRVYPMSNQAASVLDALRLACDESGVDTLTEFHVVRLNKKGDGFEAAAKDGRTVRGRCALICTGGLAAPKLGACGDGYELLKGFGHALTPRFPAIAALITPPEPVRGLKGIRAEATLTLYVEDEIAREEPGEALFSENGVSGIAAMQLARPVNEALRAGKSCRLALNFAERPVDLAARMKNLPKRTMEDFLNGIVPKRLGQTLVKAAGIELSRRAETLTGSELRRLNDVLTGWMLPVTGTQGFDQAQVTAGGANLKDFDLRTLRSLRVPGLFAAGEVLDVDGDCGGFNLQWAWSSALLAVEGIERIL